MNLAEVCRLCLVKSMKTSEELFFPIDEAFENKFSEVTNLVLDSSEGFPSTICISCVTEFEEFYNYRNGLIQKQKRLNLLLGIREEKVLIKTETKPKKNLNEPANIKIQPREAQIDEPNEQFTNHELEDDTEEYLETHDNSRVIFEEALDEDTYEIELTEHNQDTFIAIEKDTNTRDESYSNENDQYLETPEDCVEDMDQGDDDEILYAISTDELDENCIIIKSEENVNDNGSGERQKRKYVKRESHMDKKFKCWIENCHAAFSFRSTMKKHMNQVHLIFCTRSTCLMCGRNFEEYSEFLNHVKTHTRVSECDICKLTFVSEEKMQAHRTRVHKNDEHERCFQCPLCDASFKRKEHVNSHVTYKHNTDNRQYSCKECSSMFLTRQDLKNHEKSHSQVMKNCAYCPYECRDLKSIKLHCLKVHNTTKVYKCYCEESFDLFKDYQSHKKNCFSAVDSTTTE